MIRNSAALVFAMLLASCGFDKAPPETAGSPPAKPVPGTEIPKVQVETPEVETDRFEIFAQQLVEKGPGFFRFDRIRDARDGGQERQVFVEMLGDDDRAAAELSNEILQSLGFIPGHSFGDENGIRLSYTQDGGGELIRVLVRTREAHSKLNHEEATSSVYLTQALEAE